jgi:carbohydrate-selective porin OprB
VPGYNSLVAAPPFNRTELYTYWVKQEIIEDKLKFRVGKILPSADFGNVTRVSQHRASDATNCQPNGSNGGC